MKPLIISPRDWLDKIMPHETEMDRLQHAFEAHYDQKLQDGGVNEWLQQTAKSQGNDYGIIIASSNPVLAGPAAMH